MINVLLKLSDNDKRIIIILLAVFIVVLVLIAYIGYIITKVMAHQGKKINNHVSEVVLTGVIKNEKDFKRYAKRKNWRVFYSQAKVPMLIVLLSVTFYVVASLIQGKFINPFGYKKGFASLLFVWDFSTMITTPKTGAGILLNWPKLVNKPHIDGGAWIAYIFVPCILYSGLWYLYCVQGFIARYLHINKLSQKIFQESLENYINSGQFLAKQQPVQQDQQVEQPKTVNTEDLNK